MYIDTKYVGKAQAFRSLGFTEDQVKVAFVQEGLDETYADTLVKIAYLGAIGAGLRGLGAAARAVKGMGAMQTLGRGAGAAARWGAQGIRRGGMLGQMQGKAGLLAGRALKGTQAGIQNMRNAPGKTLWQGTKNFGQGAMFMQGKGVGGALGKATFAGTMMYPWMSNNNTGGQYYGN